MKNKITTIFLIIIFAFNFFLAGFLFSVFFNKDSNIEIQNLNDNYFIANKKDNLYYHFWCEIAQKIDKKQIEIFNTEEEAKKSGYQLGNCIE